MFTPIGISTIKRRKLLIQDLKKDLVFCASKIYPGGLQETPHGFGSVLKSTLFSFGNNLKLEKQFF